MHLLATKAVTLDEADQAVDLGQTPAEVVVLSFSDSDLSAAAAAWQRKSHELPTLRLASLKRLKHPLSIDLYIDSVARNARAVIVRCLGGLDYWRYGFERLASVACEKGILLAALPGDDRPDARLTALSTAAPEAVALLDRYFREGGTENVGNALGYVAHLLGRETGWSEPKHMGAAVGMTASGESASLGDLAMPTSERPVALVVFYRASLLAADTQPITALMESLAREGLEPLAVAVTSLKDPAAATEVQSLIAERRPQIILNATAFSALREDDTTALDAAGVPVLQVVLAGASREAWETSPRGLGPSDIAMNVVLPELDGRLLTRAISFKADAAVDARLEYANARHEAAPDRVDYVARLAAAWVRLGQKARGERRLALVLSDYPQRGGRTGYAVGLDTPASVEQILGLLAAEGYDTGGLDVSAADLGPVLAGQGPTIDVPLVLYRRWLGKLPESVQAQISETWGAPEADPAHEDGRFRFPCLRAGKTIILLQPDRGSVTERKQGYHDTATPAAPRVCGALCLAARSRADRRHDPSRHARHARMAARQGARFVGGVLSRGGAGPGPCRLSVHCQQSGRGRAGEAPARCRDDRAPDAAARRSRAARAAWPSSRA